MKFTQLPDSLEELPADVRALLALEREVSAGNSVAMQLSHRCAPFVSTLAGAAWMASDSRYVQLGALITLLWAVWIGVEHRAHHRLGLLLAVLRERHKANAE